MTVEAGAAARGKPAGGAMRIIRRIEPFGLIIVWIALIAVFGWLRPATFLTWANFSDLARLAGRARRRHARAAGAAHRQ